MEPETETVPTETVTVALPTAVPPTGTPMRSPTATETAVPSATPTLSPTATPERVRVFGNGNQTVNMRREPGANSAVVKTVRDGAEVTIVGVDRDDDGRIWRNVQDGDAVGWIVGTALRALPTPTVTPSSTATVAVTATPPPTQTAAASGSAAPASAAARTPTGTPEPERVEITGTGAQGANLRAEPSTSARVLQTIPDGVQLTVIGPGREADGRTWRNVRGESGTSGWIVSEVARSLATATPATTPTSAATPTRDATPTAGSAGSQTPAASGTPTPTRPPGTPSPDDPDAETGAPTPAPERVEVYDTGTQGANLRARPGRSGSVLRSVPDGAVLTIIGEDQVVDGITWRNVQLEDGATGWLAVEVVRTLVTPTPTPRPGSAGVGAPIMDESLPEDELSEEQRIATPCRPGQLKGDASTGVYYPPDHAEYAGLRQRVRCFDDASRARASGFRPYEPPPPPPEASPSPLPE